MSVSSDSLSQVRAFVAEQHTLTLSTLGPDGQPQAADVYYAESADLNLYFVSIPGSRHAANIGRDPRVAATIHADSARWRDIRGVQLEGTCARLGGAERAAAYARYTAKFPFVLADAALARALQQVGMYRMVPHWLRWIDNSLGLGHNQEWVWVQAEWRRVVAPE
jgi:uncharacterized protein YhbP (UPF0306 family)